MAFDESRPSAPTAARKVARTIDAAETIRVIQILQDERRGSSNKVNLYIEGDNHERGQEGNQEAPAESETHLPAGGASRFVGGYRLRECPCIMLH